MKDKIQKRANGEPFSKDKKEKSRIKGRVRVNLKMPNNNGPESRVKSEPKQGPAGKSDREGLVFYCDFCGIELGDLTFGRRRKYCSEKCRELALRRRASARLGIPPPKRAVSKLSNPLYFD